ncbi:hypothetical protein OHQ89_16210 [Streptomyces canus]|uniref:hypothetical protein n=1 Tax=Streptomyces canus TaxID=58343 RepID=UPI0030E0A703
MGSAIVKLYVRPAVLLLLVVLGMAAALTADLVQTLAPSVPEADPCGPGTKGSVIGTSAYAERQCKWDSPALADAQGRTFSLLIEESTNGRIRASASLKVNSSDPIVSAVRRGDAIRFPGIFAEAIFAGISIDPKSMNGSQLIWAAPTLAGDGKSGKLTIAMTAAEPSGSSSARPTPGVPLNVVAYVNSDRGVITLRTRKWVIGGARGDYGLKIRSESAHEVTVRVSSVGQFSADLASPTAVPLDGAFKSSIPEWLSHAISWGLPILRGMWGSLLAAAAWIAFFLASRYGIFRDIGRRAVLRRAEWAVGMVLIAHLMLSSIDPISMMEQRFWSAQEDGLARAFEHAGLWYPMGYPRVTGSVVVFMALVASLGVAWSRNPPGLGQGIRRRSPVVGFLTSLTGVTITLTGFAFAVHLNGKDVESSPPGAAIILPLISLGAVALVGFIATWVVSATMRPSTTTAIQNPGYVLSAGIGAFLLLIAVGVAARTLYWYASLKSGVYQVYPYNRALLVLLVGLSVAVLLGILAHRIAVPVDVNRPRAIISIILLCAAVITFLSSLWYAAHVFGTDVFYEDDYVLGQSSVYTSPLPLLVVAAILTVGLLYGAELARRRWSGLGSAAVRTAATIGALSALALFHDGNGVLPHIVRWAGLIGIAVLAYLVVIRLTMAAITGRQPRRRMLVTLVPVCAIFGVPWGDLRQAEDYGWWNLPTFALRLDGLLILVLVAVLVTILRGLGSEPVILERTLRGHRKLGIAAWFIVLSSSYSLVGAPQAGTLVVAGAGAWLLLPRGKVLSAHRVLALSPARQGSAVQSTIRAGSARRTLPTLDKTVREKVAAGEQTFSDGQAAIASLESESRGDSESIHASDGRILRISSQEVAFGSLDSRRPWKRAKWGALVGAVIGVPWTVLGLAGANPLSDGTESYPVAAWIAAIAPLTMGWIGYGLLFGFFFPLLRGQTGLGKSAWLFGCALFPTVLSTALGDPSASAWKSTGLLAIQLFAFSMTIGVLADRQVLIKHGFRPGRLVEVHNMWSVTAWASSVAIAVGTGVATLIIAGLQPFVIGVISPPTSNSPQVTSQP